MAIGTYSLQCTCVALLLQLTLIAHVGADYDVLHNVTCRQPDLTLTPRCKAFIDPVPDLHIPGFFNETELDEAAWEFATNGARCPFFDLRFHCLRLFPRCTTRNGATHVQGMCQSSCLAAKTYEGGLCHSYDIDGMCTDPSLFDPEPDCFPLLRPEDEKANWWKWGLLGLLGVIAAGLLISVAKNWYSTRRWREDPDSIEFTEEKEEREQREKQTQQEVQQGDAYINLDDPASKPHSGGRGSSSGFKSAQQARQEAIERVKQQGRERNDAIELGALDSSTSVTSTVDHDVQQ